MISLHKKQMTPGNLPCIFFVMISQDHVWLVQYAFVFPIPLHSHTHRGYFSFCDLNHDPGVGNFPCSLLFVINISPFHNRVNVNLLKSYYKCCEQTEIRVLQFKIFAQFYDIPMYGWSYISNKFKVFVVNATILY